MLSKLCLGMSCSAVSHELIVNESAILNKLSLNISTHKTRLCVDQ